MAQIVKFNKDSNFQRLRASFLDDSISLTPKEKDTKEKCRYIFTLRLKNKYSRSQAIEMFIKEFSTLENSVSQATAYRIYNKATIIYGEIDETDARAEKIILREHYFNLYQMALKDKEIELAKKILDSYRELFDFNIDENELDPGKLKAHEYHIKVDRQTLKLMKEQLSKGSVDFNKYPNIEDVEYKEVTDE
jgi:uncharacterized protein (DUF3084 family)